MKLVAYRRVSTKSQGESGLGLEGQMLAIERYAEQTGSEIIAFYTEVESGTKTDRPQLGRAMAHARRAKAILCIARLDRLARNLHFLSGLMESGVDFTACDMPSANRLTIQIMAAVAEDYAKQISDKTRMGLVAARARGTKLGGYREKAAAKLTSEARAKGVKNSALGQKTAAIEGYADLAPIVVELREQGLSLRAIADHLNAQGHATRRGLPLRAIQIHRLLGRLAV